MFVAACLVLTSYRPQGFFPIARMVVCSKARASRWVCGAQRADTAAAGAALAAADWPRPVASPWLAVHRSVTVVKTLNSLHAYLSSTNLSY